MIERAITYIAFTAEKNDMSLFFLALPMMDHFLHGREDLDELNLVLYYETKKD